MKKLNPDFVYDYFRKNNCLLLEKYVNSRKKMNYICSCGQQSQITFGNFKQGTRCHKCAINSRADNKRLSYDKVYDFFKKNNCKLLTKKYKNSTQYLEYICSCGKKTKTKFRNFKKSKNCFDCGIVKRSEKNKYTFDYVANYFEKNNCTLLEKNYINSTKSMKYVCICKNESYISFSAFRNGKRCKKCVVKNQSGENSHRWNPDRELVERRKKARHICSNLLNTCLKRINKNKTSSTNDLLKYSPYDLDIFLKNHPNYLSTMRKIKLTKDKFSIDHIFPIKAFVDYNLDKEEFLWLMNHFDNLTPMPLRENNRKNDKYDKELFEAWLISKNISINTNTQS